MLQQHHSPIVIEVETAYLADQSNPDNNHYVFSYTVTLRNRGSQGARLLTRHWIITDADGRKQEVKGEGVVGERPHLAPGESYSYSSGTFIGTPVGSMHGSYGMANDDGSRFNAPIPPFSLAVPSMIH